MNPVYGRPFGNLQGFNLDVMKDVLLYLTIIKLKNYELK